MASGKELFDDYNRKYFWGRLPRYRVRSVPYDGGQDWFGVYGYCDRVHRIIFIRENLPIRIVPDREHHTFRREPTSVDQTLLHEMCHIRGGTHYSRKFRMELRRLAAAGETWAAKEADKFDRLPSWNRQMKLIRKQLDELASEQPRPDFHVVVLRLAGQAGFENDFLRRVPWLRAAWDAACRGKR